MLPIERAHYAAWGERLAAALGVAYPRTLWLVPDLDAVLTLPRVVDSPRQFQIVAMSQDGGRQVTTAVPLAVVVDEEAFALVVFALGRELERRLAALVQDEG